MPPKRPAPLSDAALAPREPPALGREPAALGETNAGAPLPVKNTFIDVPSGFTPTSTQAKKQPVSTAPAQVGVAAGFVRSSILASVQNAIAVPPTPSSPASPMKITSALQAPASPKKPAMAVQRPGGHGLPDWALVTPSPTGSSSFAATRYQLFGGPAPVQEATHSALAPQYFAVAPPGPLQAMAMGVGAPGGPLSYGPSTFGQTAAAPAEVPPPPPRAPTVELTRPAAAAAKARQLPSVEQESRSKGSHSDDEEDSDDAEGAPAAKGPEDAPKPPPGALHPSIGSEQHEEGTCKRCCFFPRNRCHNGYNCEFCHYEHEKRKRKSKKSKKKNKESASATAEGAEGAEAATPAVSSSSAPAGTDAAAASAAGGVPPEASSACPTCQQPWEQGPGPGGCFYGATGEPWLQMPLLSLPADAAGKASADGEAAVPQLVTYQWTDAVPSQSPLLAAAAAATAASTPGAPAPSYFATATGFTAQPPGAIDPQWQGHQPYSPSFPPPPHAQGLPPMPPPYAPYPGFDALDHRWGGQMLGVPPPAMPMPMTPPPYAEPSLPPQAPELLVSSPAHAAHSPLPPPAEEPKLPQALQASEDAGPPPPEPPRLPPAVQVQAQEQEGPIAPPPVCSPKLPKDLTMSLEQETPPVPGESPT